MTPVGLEPTTTCLRGRYSTIELRSHKVGGSDSYKRILQPVIGSLFTPSGPSGNRTHVAWVRARNSPIELRSQSEDDQNRTGITDSTGRRSTIEPRPPAARSTIELGGSIKQSSHRRARTYNLAVKSDCQKSNLVKHLIRVLCYHHTPVGYKN